MGDLINVIKEVPQQALVAFASIVSLLWTLEKVLEVISRLTPWKWDDNLGVILANLLRKLGGKK